jgi:hypothetical protein
VDRSSIRHDFQRICEQIYQNAIDAMPVHREEDAVGYVLQDAYRLEFSSGCDLLHGVCHYIPKIGDFKIPVSAPVPIEALFQEFAHAERSAIHVSRKAMDLRLGGA